MINLPDVTLLAVSSIKLPETISSLVRSSEQINFGSIVLVSHEKPKNLPEKIEYKKYRKINDIMDFNYFAFKDLTFFVHTSHVLMVQHHAWIINPYLWKNEWLEYDYIGAPWAYSDEAYICHDTGEHVRVGNGGFSLRSKKLLDIPNKYNLPLLEEKGWYNEDGNICVYHRKRMLELGVKYAPLEEAVIFSFERPVPENAGIRTFGFHINYMRGDNV